MTLSAITKDTVMIVRAEIEIDSAYPYIEDALQFVLKIRDMAPFKVRIDTWGPNKN